MFALGFVSAMKPVDRDTAIREGLVGWNARAKTRVDALKSLAVCSWAIVGGGAFALSL